MMTLTDNRNRSSQASGLTETAVAKRHGRKISEKLKVLAGSSVAMAVGFAGPSSVVEADIVASLSTPISSPVAPGTNNWDVDGDGTNDFELIKYYSSGDSYYSVVPFGVAFFDDANGGRLVVPTAQANAGISKLPAGLIIGPALGTAYKFHVSRQSYNSITRTYRYFGGTLDFATVGFGAFSGGWALGDSDFFGFKFTNAGGTETFYGWGEMSIAADGTGFSILQAYYNDTAGASIEVGDTSSIPEPSAVALLALGAAGLATWRRRRKE